MTLTKEELRRLWSTGEEINGYKVHKMSYGDYFIEPSIWKGGEKDGFSINTKWFTKILVDKKVFYTTIQ